MKLSLCRELGYTLVELEEKVSSEELILWAAFFKLESDELKKARKKK